MEIASNSLPEHPAASAWRTVAPGCGKPRGITLLKKGHSRVYRLEGAGPRGAAVIAKRCKRAAADKERIIYQKILPAFGLTGLCVYGSADGYGSAGAAGATCWLFLEDAGGERYSNALEEHRALAGRWLGALHASSTLWRRWAGLPSRGPGYYLKTLRSVQRAIHQNFANPALKVEERGVLEAMLAQYSVLESRWSRIAACCDYMPQTLVHGDLVSKNAHVRASQGEMSLLVMDWETAGWGVPAIDLYSLDADLTAYWPAARQSWTGQTSLVQAAAIGKIFRLVVAASWETGHLFTPWVARTMRRLKLYQTALGACLLEAGWEQ